ncbi:hypothetical protein PENARI_c003G09895 [Penicillium arizonense]|uniref:Uncharacterized protein n=1 Tax=Penicillium arizonense TaxID=1835702 RepID=A0A1F5LU50_PENAI|nr:hypothetical protein PENARI_c003G09895 [Penicillium arizonense]OGE56636.1 hypothetical protein PENARI_c003G09895 [Penicillium arizonense]
MAMDEYACNLPAVSTIRDYTGTDPTYTTTLYPTNAVQRVSKKAQHMQHLCLVNQPRNGRRLVITADPSDHPPPAELMLKAEALSTLAPGSWRICNKLLA